MAPFLRVVWRVGLLHALVAQALLLVLPVIAYVDAQSWVRPPALYFFYSRQPTCAQTNSAGICNLGTDYPSGAQSVCDLFGLRVDPLILLDEPPLSRTTSARQSIRCAL